MGITINRRVRTKQDYQVAVVGASISLLLSIASLVLFIKTEENN